MFLDSSTMIALMSTSHLFSEHPMLDEDKAFRQAGPMQYAIHWFYGVAEPTMMRVADVLICSK